ncbi:alkaline phosphatase family protein [Acidobacteriota bacterium]
MARKLIVLSCLVIFIGVLSPGCADKKSDAKPEKNPVLFIAVDGAEWNVIWPLIKKGRLPTLERLINQGAWAELRTYQPMDSPVIWNSIATGMTPAEHGVLSFTMADEDIYDSQGKRIYTGSGKMIPVTGVFRKTKAFWNMASEQDKSVGVIGWWATWPAEQVRGVMVSDRFAYTRFNLWQSGEESREFQTYPPELYDRLSTMLIRPEDVSDSEVSRFMKVDRNGRQEDWRTLNDINNEFDFVYASTQTHGKLMNHLIEDYDLDLYTVYFRGIDIVSHYFWKYMEPTSFPGQVSAEEEEKYGRVIEEFYVLQDEIINDMLERLGPETTVIICSDHGFQPLINRAKAKSYFNKQVPETISGWHRIYGVLIMSGGPIRKGAKIESTTIMDICPTLLYLLDLPVAKNMRGRVLTEAVEPSYLEEHPIRYIPTYGPRRFDPDHLVSQSRPEDKRILEELRSLGYIQ